MNQPTVKVAFLDRDGVINHDSGYIGNPEDFELVAGVPDALLLLRRLGYKLVVVTNQSGIGRGYYDEAAYQKVTARMRELLASQGVTLDLVLHCPHRPEDRCDCRKPKPGMLRDGAARLGANLEASIIFGDKASDMAAGRAAGVGRRFLVGTPKDAHAADELRRTGGYGSDLLACVRLLSEAPIARDACDWEV